MPEVEQVQTENQPEAESEQTLVEQVGQLLRPEEVKEEPKEVVQPQEPEVIEGEPEVPQEPKEPDVIDDSVIEQYPVLKMYRGKPIKEVLKAYDSIVRKFTSTSQELAKLKQKQTTIPKPEEVPDAVENPEDFKKWIKEYTEQVREDERTRVLNQPEPPNLEVEIAKYLPKDADVQKVVDGWVRHNSEMIFNEFGDRRPEVTAFYNQNPEILISQIVKFYNLSSQAQKNELQVKTEGKKLAYENVKGAIRNANANKENIPNSTVNAIKRTDSFTPEEELLGKILTKLPQG